MSKKYQLHDAGFKAAMMDMRVAKDFFTHYLPKHVQQTIDLSSLTLCSNTYIDPELTALHTDVLYQVNIHGADKGFIFLHTEQQTKPDKLMNWRMLKYTCRIIENYLQKTKSHTLPLIVPIVLYNGKKPYPYSVDIFNLFGENTALAREMMLTKFKLVDLTQIQDEKIKTHLWSGLMEMLLKHAKSGDIMAKLELLKEAFKIIVNTANTEHYVLSMIKYLIETGESIDKSTLFQFFNANLTPELETKAMTLADQLRQEGRQEGEQSGFQKGIEHGTIEGEKLLIQRLLSKRFGSLSDSYKEMIEEASPDTLMLWAEKLLDVKTIDEVFKEN